MVLKDRRGRLAQTRPLRRLDQRSNLGKLVQCLESRYRGPNPRGMMIAFDISLKFSVRTGCLSRNTAYNPLTIEGKKTVSFELISQTPDRGVDYVLLPVGDGVNPERGDQGI